LIKSSGESFKHDDFCSTDLSRYYAKVLFSIGQAF
jgi:hypothetical protein